jgi:hypothetical protein
MAVQAVAAVCDLSQDRSRQAGQAERQTGVSGARFLPGSRWPERAFRPPEE